VYHDGDGDVNANDAIDASGDGDGHSIWYFIILI
jgi:hypothetical protein